MKKTTLTLIVCTAMFVCVGWWLFESIGIYFLAASVIFAIAALFMAIKEKKQ